MLSIPPPVKILMPVMLFLVFLGLLFFQFFSPPSSKPTFSSDQACNLVMEQPEVKSWSSLFTGPNHTSPAGSQIGCQADLQDSGLYEVHLYEILSDHTATFNFYTLNPKTRHVVKQFGNY